MVDLESLVSLPSGVLKTLVWLWQNEAPFADPMQPGDIDLGDVMSEADGIAALTGISAVTIRTHIRSLRNRGWIYEAHGKEWIRRAVIVWPRPGQVAVQGTAPRRVVTDRAAQSEAREDLQTLRAIQKLRALPGDSAEIYDVWVELRKPSCALLHESIYRLGERDLVLITGTNLVVIPLHRRQLAIPILSGSNRGHRGVTLILTGNASEEALLEKDAR